MRTAIYQLENQIWNRHPLSKPMEDGKVQLVLCFGSRSMLTDAALYDRIREKFPIAQILLCSTAGEIYQDKVLENSVVVTALFFEKTAVTACSVTVKETGSTYTAAIALAKALPREGLKNILIFSDGSLVNGSELVKGMSALVDKSIAITGGLAGDNANFQSTLVGLNGPAEAGRIVAVGFYGNAIKMMHGSQGGWDSFGLEKRVTNSSGNILIELENKNALDLYKKYLGAAAAHLPGSALLFPLSVILPGSNKPVVRTILSINEQDKYMVFAGDIPVGSRVRFMKADLNQLTQAASDAAGITLANNQVPDFSLLISCVGRKLVLGDRTNEEVVAVSNRFKGDTILSGFYSYGEISPFNEGGECQLHNQTMTITSFYEL